MNGSVISRGVVIGALAMSLIVAISNYLVQFFVAGIDFASIGGLPFPSAFLTYAAFTYPISFLITDLSNRAMGPEKTRIVVYAGFALGVVLSILLADLRIAVASGTAFLVAQLLDVAVFDRLRKLAWWQTPLISTALASVVDTVLFFSIAFYGTDVPWQTLSIGDLFAKLAMAVLMLAPYRALMNQVLTQPQRA